MPTHYSVHCLLFLVYLMGSHNVRRHCDVPALLATAILLLAVTNMVWAFASRNLLNQIAARRLCE